MKNFGGTVVFAVLVAIVAGLAIWQYKKALPADAEKTVGDVLFPNHTGEVQEIDFVGSTRQFKLKKDAAGWSIIEPFKDAADDEAVNKNIEAFFGLRATVLETGDGPIQWEKYGLADPDETVTVKDRDGKQWILKIGRVRTYDKGFYLRRGDEPKLIVAATTLMDIFNMTADGLRNRKLDIPGSKILSYSVSSRLKGKEIQYSLKPENDVWGVVGQKVKLSPRLVTELLGSIRELKASGFEVEDKNSVDPNELKKHGLTNPVAEIKITYENPEGADKPKIERDIKFGQTVGNGPEAGDVFYVSNGNIAVYKTNKTQLQTLLKSPDSLRDPKSPFAFDQQKVAYVKFVSPDFKSGLILQKKKSADGKVSWQTINQSTQKVNEPVVMDFIANINVLEALEFLPRKSERPFKPEYSAELKGEDGTSLIKIEFGSMFKDVKSGLESYVVKSSLADSLVSVRKASIDKLTKPNLVQSAAEKGRVTETKKVQQEPRTPSTN